MHPDVKDDETEEAGAKPKMKQLDSLTEFPEQEKGRI